MSKPQTYACHNCFWFEQCGTYAPCQYYYNVKEDEYTDGQIRDMVERGRREYEEAWRNYANQYD